MPFCTSSTGCSVVSRADFFSVGTSSGKLYSGGNFVDILTNISLVKGGVNMTVYSRTRAFRVDKSLYLVHWSGEVMGFAAAHLA
jgi:hypothetical protein